MKRELTTALTKYVVNPVMNVAAGRIPGWALLETRGRKTGRPHRNPVGEALKGNTLWLVAEHGRGADYVRNIEKDPHVRVRVRGRWRSGTAHPMPGDDALRRQREVGINPINRVALRLVATDPLTIRVDLDAA